MQYFREDNTDSGLVEKIVSNRFQVGIYPVIFGMRVRAGYKDSYVYNIDYCCQMNKQYLDLIYSIVIHILYNHHNEENPFNYFPYQNKKPFFEDENFKYLLNYINYDNFEKYELKSIEKMREEFFKKVGYL